MTRRSENLMVSLSTSIAVTTPPSPLSSGGLTPNNARHLQMSRSASNKNKVPTKPKVKAAAAEKKLPPAESPASRVGSQHASSGSSYMRGDRVSHPKFG